MNQSAANQDHPLQAQCSSSWLADQGEALSMLKCRAELWLASRPSGRVALHVACCLNARSLRQWRFCLAGIGREFRPVGRAVQRLIRLLAARQPKVDSAVTAGVSCRV